MAKNDFVAIAGDEYVDRAEMARRLNVGKSTTYNMGLPAPYRLSARLVRWKWSEIEQWLSSRR